MGVALTCFFHAPARWLTDSLRLWSQHKAAFADARGTVWQGSTRLVVIEDGGGSAVALPGRLEWRLRPRWPGMAVELHANCCMNQPWTFSVFPRWGGVRISAEDSISQWPVQLLVGLGSPWNTLNMTGQLRISTQGFWVDWSKGARTVGGNAQLDVFQLSSHLSTLRPVGSYRLSVQGGAAAVISLETLEGTLRLSGSGQLNADGLRFEGLAKTASEQEAVLARVLEVVGRREGAQSIIQIGKML